MKPIYVSFYTPDYRDEAAQLIRTLDAFGLEHDIRERSDAGRWEHNCNQKPAFIREMMLIHEGRPIVWLDADARVVAQPSLFDKLGCDFAAHWLDWEDDRKELLSGTVYFGATHKAWLIAQAWHREAELWPDIWDQKLLQAVVEGAADLDVLRLGPEFNFIFDISREKYPSVEPVIMQMQASRRLRK